MTSDYRELIAWQKGVELAKGVYMHTRQMPAAEQFGLTSQMRRAAVSIPSNIAEGNARHSRRDYIRFLTMARGSLAELTTQLTIAEELGLIPRSDSVWNLASETARILQGLIGSLQQGMPPSAKR